MPPVPSGIAACSAGLVAELRKRHQIDVYTDEPPAAPAPGTSSAHAFVSRHRINPYDLTVYQVGNSSHHDYLWPYLFRYPGLTVLHDAHLHHARAAALLRTKRAGDYRAEFAANHPGVPHDLAELAVAGFDNHLYYSWPMTRLVVEASRLTAVHAPSLARQLKEDLPHAAVAAIRLAHGELLGEDRVRRARSQVRAAHGISDEAVVFGVFGGLTPEKRLAQVFDALAAILPYAPSAHLLLAGAAARHYAVAADVRARGLQGRTTITGYLDTEAGLTDCIAACDVSLNLRWPTAREISGPWLRALAAGRPTVTMDLEHLVDVPALDPRTWRSLPGSGMRAPGSDPERRSERAGLPDPGSRTPDPDSDSDSRVSEPVTIAIDILDEAHSLRAAMRRLASDPALRATIGAAGRRYWEREHSMPHMLEDYERILADAASRPTPRVPLPAHLVTNGDQVLQRVADEFGVGDILGMGSGRT